jgi:hypothetical protein
LTWSRRGHSLACLSSLGLIAALRQFGETAFVAFAALFAIVDPPGSAPIFLAKTADISSEERESLARPIGVYSFQRRRRGRVHAQEPNRSRHDGEV